MPTDSMIAVTGEVERVTDFEKGLPDALVERDGNIQSETITEFKRIKPEVIVPIHCTGWRLLRDSQRNSLHPSFATVLVQR